MSKLSNKDASILKMQANALLYITQSNQQNDLEKSLRTIRNTHQKVENIINKITTKYNNEDEFDDIDAPIGYFRKSPSRKRTPPQKPSESGKWKYYKGGKTQKRRKLNSKCKK